MMLPEPTQVFCTRAPATSYERYEDVRFPELPDWAQVTAALVALRSLFMHVGLDQSNQGTRDWNPLSTIIHEGQKVLIKPNWVSHQNVSGDGLDCLVTHTSVIDAILHYVAKARPRCIIIGDAPIQGCDFEAL